MYTSARVEAKKYFKIVTTNASFCLFICTFVFASNSGDFRINDFLLFFTPLLLLNYVSLIYFYSCKKVGVGGKAKAPQPLPLHGPCILSIKTKTKDKGRNKIVRIYVNKASKQGQSRDFLCLNLMNYE